MEGKLGYGVWGFVSGAAFAMIVGFMWGGWTTSSTTQQISDDAVMANRTAICVAQFRKQPDVAARLKEFEAMTTHQRGEFVDKGGWDRMPGEEKATWGVASACVTALESLLQKDGRPIPAS